MKMNFNKADYIINFSYFILCIIFNIFIYMYTRNILICAIACLFCIISLMFIFIYHKFFKRYIEDICFKLSDMLSSIYDLKEKEVFTCLDDSIFSKLQYQTIKVIKILKSQNIRIESDKNQIKSLISDIAHQLKTPLTNIKMYSELLDDDSISDKEKKEFNEVIMLSINRLIFLIESMIKMSRLEGGVINLKRECVDINETVLAAINQVRKKAQKKSIDIKFFKINKRKVNLDLKWTAEALFNIIENGVKYSKENTSICVKITEYQMFIRIDITNEGTVISEDEKSKIFKRFYRGVNSTDEEGIGIGLYLSRKIISMQDGYIKTDSKNNKTTFSVFLPI